MAGAIDGHTSIGEHLATRWYNMSTEEARKMEDAFAALYEEAHEVIALEAVAEALWGEALWGPYAKPW